MTTPPADPKTTPPAGPGDGEAGRIQSIDQKLAALKDDILSAVRDMVGGAQDRERGHLTDPDQSRGARAQAAGQNLDQMIADAIKVNDDARAKEAADNDLRAKLEEATKEKPPVDRRKVHRVMGWGEPAQ